MTNLTVETIGQSLAASLCRDDDACVALCAKLVRLLSNGQPVSREHLAAALGTSRAAVDATLRQVPNLECDDRDNIVAAGLSLLPTPHHFRVNGNALYTWCALETLMFPVVLQQSAQVASRCPVSGVRVRLTVTPEGIDYLDPAGALVSVVVPDASGARCDVRGVFCRHVHFFGGPEAGAAWRAAHPEAVLLSVEDAHAVARFVAQKRYGKEIC